jgi:membrane carboxypeptidase/penicillin-binding protein PbpC
VLAGTARGEGFSAYRVQVGQGLNPRSWVQVGVDGTTPVDEGQLQVWDTREMSDGLYAVKLSVVHEDQRLESAIIQVTVDNTAPQAAILAPQPGQKFNYLSERRITLQLTTSDAVGIDRVEWLVDGQPVGSSRQEPFVWVWETTRGEHKVSARVVDLAGNFTQTQVVKFSVTR